jgi:restriction endonuclease S subunit
MLVDVIADFIQNWLEDNINPKLYEEMEITINKLSTQEKFDSEVVEIFTKMIDNRADSFESQLSKLQITE